MKRFFLVLMILSTLFSVRATDLKTIAEKGNEETVELAGLLAVKGTRGVFYSPEGRVLKKMKLKRLKFVKYKRLWDLHSLLKGLKKKVYKEYKGIDRQHILMYSFREGLALWNGTGFMDINGNFVIKSKFYDGPYTGFFEGLSRVYLNESVKDTTYNTYYSQQKVGFINKEGEFVIGPYFVDMEPYLNFMHFSEGLVLYTVGQFASYQECMYGFMNKTGEIIIEPKFYYHPYAVNGFIDGMAVVTVKDEDVDDKILQINGGEYPAYAYKQGIINKKGEYIVEPKFNQIKGPEGGVFQFITQRTDRAGCFTHYGFVNDKGELITEHEFDEIAPFQEGIAAFRKDSLWGYINKKGELLVEAKFNASSAFHEGLAQVILKGQGVGFIDKSGNWAFPPKADNEDNEFGNFNEGLAAFRQAKKWGFIDKTGKVIVEAQFRKQNRFKDGLATITDMKKWTKGVIDKKGKFIVEPKYDNIYRVYEFNNNFINKISKEDSPDRRGILTNKGEVIIVETYLEEYLVYR